MSLILLSLTVHTALYRVPTISSDGNVDFHIFRLNGRGAALWDVVRIRRVSWVRRALVLS